MMSNKDRGKPVIGRRMFLRKSATLGLVGATSAALMGGLDRTVLAIPPANTNSEINTFNFIHGSSCIVFADSAGAYYVKDTGIGNRIGSLIVNANVITAYGASLGAGTVNTSTTTAGIQEAINCLRGSSGSGGGKVQIQAGVYNVSSTINLYPSIALVGIGQLSAQIGRGTSLIVPSASLNAPCIQIIVDPSNNTNVSFPTIADLTIVGSAPVATSQDGVNISDANGNLLDVLIRNTGIFHMGGNGINDQSGTKLWLDGTNYLELCLQNGIVINNASANVRAHDIYVFGNTLAGIFATSYNYINWRGGEIWNNVQYGLYLAPNVNTPAYFDSLYLADNGGGAFSDINFAPLNPMVGGVVNFIHCNILEDRGAGTANHLISIGGTKALNLIFNENFLSTTHGTNLASFLFFGGALITGNLNFKNNIGLNPFNLLTNSFSASTIGLNGSGATPTASTDYTVYGCDIHIVAADSANTNNAIIIKDGAGNTITSPAHTLDGTTLIPIGWKINWGAFTGAAGAVSVYGV